MKTGGIAKKVMFLRGNVGGKLSQIFSSGQSDLRCKNENHSLSPLSPFDLTTVPKEMDKEKKAVAVFMFVTF